MRKRMIAGNWKMNKTFSEAIVLAQGIVDELSAGTGDVDVVVAPPAVDLKGVSEVLTQATRSGADISAKLTRTSTARQRH